MLYVITILEAGGYGIQWYVSKYFATDLDVILNSNNIKNIQMLFSE